MGIARCLIFRRSPARSYQLTRGPAVYLICAVLYRCGLSPGPDASDCP